VVVVVVGRSGMVVRLVLSAERDAEKEHCKCVRCLLGAGLSGCVCVCVCVCECILV
jgi:hypothetical protein